MPLPHPPGYQPRSQTRVDRRRVLLAGVLFSLMATVLLLLGRRAAAHAGNALPHASLERALVVLLVAGGCGAWGETMRQLARIARAREQEDAPPGGGDRIR
jgi:H+/gluconate symporter-like permease